MTASVRYMDQGQERQLYTMSQGRVRVTDREMAAAQIEDTHTLYQQHMTITTGLRAADGMVNEREVAEQLLRMIADRRTDADIYALAVHSDGQDDVHLHAHVAFGTRTTLRHDDLRHFREAAYALECDLAPRWETEMQNESGWKQVQQHNMALEATDQSLSIGDDRSWDILGDMTHGLRW